MEPRENSELIAEVLAGDRKAAEEFFRRFGNAIRKAVLSVAPKGDAVTGEDLFMDACGHIMADNWRVLRKLKDTDLTAAYLITVSRRHALQVTQKEHRRDSFRRHGFPLEACTREMLEPRSPYTPEQKQALRETASTLKPGDRLFVAEAFGGEFSTDELCRRFGLPNANALYKKKNKMKNILRKRMKLQLLRRRGRYEWT